jgi:hypothetical protein
VKSPGEHARLARAFGVSQTKLKTAVMTTTGASLVGLLTPVGWVLAGGMLAGFGGFALADRRAVQVGLREVDNWGFPVEGYRAWLLAEEPTFEIELARDVDLDVLVTSTHAIDDTIEVSRTRDRTFRFVTRRVALPAQHKDGLVAYVGDRQLIKELHARLLAPLHADVGIQRMRMGDRATLPAAPALLPAAGPAVEGSGFGAFRESAMAAPPALQALVHDGGDRELPHEARKVRNRAERVVYATGSAPHGGGTVVAFTAGGAMSGVGWFQLTGMCIGAIAGFGAGIVAAVQGNRRNARRVGESVAGHGFPIEGYEDWLISGRPIFDIELANAIDPAWLLTQIERLPKAFSVSVNAEVAWVEEVKWLEDKLVRIETRPTLIEPASKLEPFYGGSHAMFNTFIVQVLAPLHQRAGIAAVKMGGYLTRRV